MQLDLVMVQNHRGALYTINDRGTGFLFMFNKESNEASVAQFKTIELLSDWTGLITSISSNNARNSQIIKK
jgi:hypothetical protein